MFALLLKQTWRKYKAILMIKPQTNHKQNYVEKPQTDVITFNHEKGFRDLGSGLIMKKIL